MSAIYTTQRDGERLDLICYLWYGTLAGRVVERVLAANPGLAARDPAKLPSGVPIRMPTVSAQRPPGLRIF